jgi:hypothetical protein
MERYQLLSTLKIWRSPVGRKIILESFVGRIEYLSSLVAVMAHGARSCLTLRVTPWRALKETIQKVKIMKAKMSSTTAGTMVLGALKEFVTNERYFRYSSVGMEYSHLTDKGKEELDKMLEVNLALLRDSLQYEEEENAKKLMLTILKS